MTDYIEIFHYDPASFLDQVRKLRGRTPEVLSVRALKLPPRMRGLPTRSLAYLGGEVCFLVRETMLNGSPSGEKLADLVLGTNDRSWVCHAEPRSLGLNYNESAA